MSDLILFLTVLLGLVIGFAVGAVFGVEWYEVKIVNQLNRGWIYLKHKGYHVKPSEFNPK